MTLLLPEIHLPDYRGAVGSIPALADAIPALVGTARAPPRTTWTRRSVNIPSTWMIESIPVYGHGNGGDTADYGLVAGILLTGIALAGPFALG
ncbi:hypothetical protein [Nocardia crassostreae]|uniref:hypothetical protein n=1 Tax=Nocardia crassostreae TaxID=53428 RepID=UPI0008305880|nr:hypothetical protein [Nocardia crassostreae]